MIDTNQLKELITDDDIIFILNELGADFVQDDNKQTIFYSICHHPEDSYNHKPKLYWYKNSKTFFCFSCGFQGDIFSLIQKVKNISFKESLKWITSILKIELRDNNKSFEIDNWQKDLKKFLPDYEEKQPIQIYDSSILKLFENKFHKDWIDYGISIETLKKFKIGFYARCNQITIPVYYNSDLIGIRVRALNDNDIERGKYRPLQDLNRNIYKFPTNQVFYGWDENRQKIKESKTAWIVEAEKTVLKFDTWGCNKCLAVFGSKISKEHINKLLQLGVENVILMMDSDFHSLKDEEYKLFVDKMNKLIDKLKPYFKVEICFNNINADAYKFSPTDYSLEDFKKIYKRRIKCN